MHDASFWIKIRCIHAAPATAIANTPLFLNTLPSLSFSKCHRYLHNWVLSVSQSNYATVWQSSKRSINRSSVMLISVFRRPSPFWINWIWIRKGLAMKRLQGCLDMRRLSMLVHLQHGRDSNQKFGLFSMNLIPPPPPRYPPTTCTTEMWLFFYLTILISSFSCSGMVSLVTCLTNTSACLTKVFRFESIGPLVASWIVFLEPCGKRNAIWCFVLFLDSGWSFCFLHLCVSFVVLFKNSSWNENQLWRYKN